MLDGLGNTASGVALILEEVADLPLRTWSHINAPGECYIGPMEQDFQAAFGVVTIWWTPPTPGFTLQSADSLSPANWVNAPSGPTNPITVPATLPARFYRLTKP